MNNPTPDLSPSEKIAFQKLKNRAMVLKKERPRNWFGDLLTEFSATTFLNSIGGLEGAKAFFRAIGVRRSQAYEKTNILAGIVNTGIKLKPKQVKMIGELPNEARYEFSMLQTKFIRQAELLQNALIENYHLRRLNNEQSNHIEKLEHILKARNADLTIKDLEFFDQEKVFQEMKNEIVPLENTVLVMSKGNKKEL